MQGREAVPRAIEHVMPQPQCREYHSRHVQAAPSLVWAALASVTMEDLWLTRALMTVRHLGSRGQPPPARPLLTHGPVTLLFTDPETYALGGAIMRTWQLHPQRRDVTTTEDMRSDPGPGWVKVLTDFAVVATQNGSLLSTETRCQATDPRTRQRFAVYWRLIRPFNGLVRRDILRAVDQRALRALQDPGASSAPR